MFILLAFRRPSCFVMLLFGGFFDWSCIVLRFVTSGASLLLLSMLILGYRLLIDILFWMLNVTIITSLFLVDVIFWRSFTCREEAKRLAFKLKKITVADIIETMKVTVEPFSLQNNQICRIYKLEMKLYRPDHYHEYAGISSEDCEEILSVDFLRALEDAIKNHLNLLDKINGIQNFTADSQSVAPNDGDEDFSSSKAERDEEDDDGGDGDNEEQEDLGLDAVKQKRQATDEMDYDDDYDERVNEEATRAGSESEDNDEDEVEFRKDNEVEMLDAKDGHLESPSKAEVFSTSESLKTKTKSRAKSKKKIRRQFNRKDDDRSIFVEAKGFYFKVHFRFTNEAHILLAQVRSHLPPHHPYAFLGKSTFARTTFFYF